MFSPAMIGSSTTGTGGEVELREVFNMTLRSGTSAQRDVTTGINMTKGGLVLTKSPTQTGPFYWFDTANEGYYFRSDSQGGRVSTNFLNSFNDGGHSISGDSSINLSGQTYIDYTFRNSSKFFQVLTYVGDGTGVREIPHDIKDNLGMVIVKPSTSASWAVQHTNISASNVIFLNNKSPATTSSGYWNNTRMTDKVLTVGSSLNANGVTYTVYLFARNTDAETANIYTTGWLGNGNINIRSIYFGFRPSFVLVKASGGTASSTFGGESWNLYDIKNNDTSFSGTDDRLDMNLSSTSVDVGRNMFDVTTTGINIRSSERQMNYNGENYICLAVRL